MTTSPKISIIIPVYNAEKYLRQCLDSVLAQTYSDFEVLLINDGSKDNSGKICDEYAAKDTRFTVFHKENGGVSSARNLGLENAQGEWVTFVDSDDYIADEFLEVFINYNDQVDFKLMGVKKKNKKQETDHFCFANSEVFLLAEFLSKYSLYQYFAGPWAKFFKAKIIRENKLRFDEALFWGEDALFNIQYLRSCTQIATIRKELYFYREVDTGLASIRLNFDYALGLAENVKHGLVEIQNIANISFNFSPHLSLLLDSVIYSLYKSGGSRAETYKKLKRVNARFRNSLLDIYRNTNGRGKVAYFLLKAYQLKMLNLFFRLIVK